ncbi:MAG: hypothetical protein J7518_04740 [Nocardioidaceae bacterium]|nr:hypothetical protein [Nocardioidaceae bacterium]
MATKQSTSTHGSSDGFAEILDALPVDRLKREAMDLGKALVHHGVVRLGEGVQTMAGRVAGSVSDLAAGTPSPGDVVGAALSAGAPVAEAPGKVAGKVSDTVKGTLMRDDSKKKPAAKKGSAEKSGSSGGRQETDLKVTNIVEAIDVPVDRETAYDLWTRFEEFPAFMKKVETVKQDKDEVVTWKAQIFLSHRQWKATIVDQVRPEHIVWKSEADKGRVDGAVTFHELAPDLTRVLVSLEYHPQGLFERTGNLWHAQGRRVRLELKHFRRHVSNRALLQQDEIDGWKGEIHDGKATTPRKKAASKPAARKSTASKSTASKSTASKSTASKSTASKSTARKSTARKSTARKSTTGSGSGRPASRSRTAKKTASSSSSRSRSRS